MKRARINPVSDKRKVENVRYEAEKVKWRAGHDGRCEMMFLQGLDAKGRPIHAPHGCKLPYAYRCAKRAQHNPHHMARRGKLLADPQYFMGVCFEHHEWIENNGKESEKLGYLIRIYERH